MAGLAAAGALCAAASAAPAQALVRPISHTTVRVSGGVTLTRGIVSIDGATKHTYVLTVDLRGAGLNTVAAHGMVNSSGETLSSMVARTHAVAGVNGDIFDLTADRAPYGGEVSGSIILKTPNPGTPDQFYVQSNGIAGIGPVTTSGILTWSRVHLVHGRKVTVGYRKAFDTVNNVGAAAGGRLGYLTPSLGTSAVPSNCYLVTMTVTRAGLRVTSTARTGARVRLAGNQRALLGCKSTGDWLRTAFPVGTVVHASAVMRAAASPSSLHITTLLGGPRILVWHGAAHNDTASGFQTWGANPESWLCVDRSGHLVQLGVLDGRDWDSNGVTLAELTGYLVTTGCWDGLVLDGGGSTALSASLNGTAPQIQDDPATGAWDLRPIVDALLVYVRAS